MENYEWNKYFIVLQKCCKNSYLKNFQYKLLHRIIATNTFLHKINLVNTKLCTFCKNDDETIEHLFYECIHTQHLLYALFDFLKEVFPTLDLEKKSFFLGYTNEPLLVNLLLIITKNYTYKCK